MFISYGSGDRAGCYAAYLKERADDDRPRIMVDQCRNVSVRDEGTCVKVKSGRNLSHETGALCRSDMVIPQWVSVYYFEAELTNGRPLNDARVSTLDSSRNASDNARMIDPDLCDVAIGYATANTQPDHMLGTAADSIAYRSSCGRVIRNGNYQDEDRDTLVTSIGDVVGMLLDRFNKQVVVTVNGRIKGSPVKIDDEIAKNDLFVMVSLMMRTSCVIMNFGRPKNRPFVFDVDNLFADIMNAYWADKTREFAETPVVDIRALNALCVSHLAYSGYHRTVEELVKEDETTEDLIADDPNWTRIQAHDLEFRSNVRDAIMEGRVGQAIVMVNNHRGNFWQKYPYLFFYLLNQCFLESVLGFDEAYDCNSKIGGLLSDLIDSQVRIFARSAGANAQSFLNSYLESFSERGSAYRPPFAEDPVANRDIHLLNFGRKLNSIWRMYSDSSPKSPLFADQSLKELFSTHVFVPSAANMAMVAQEAHNSSANQVTIERRIEIASTLNLVILDDADIAGMSQIEAIIGHGRNLIDLVEKSTDVLKGFIVPSRCILFPDALIKSHLHHNLRIMPNAPESILESELNITSDEEMAETSGTNAEATTDSTN